MSNIFLILCISISGFFLLFHIEEQNARKSGFKKVNFFILNLFKPPIPTIGIFIFFCLNLFKNSIESLKETSEKMGNFIKKINVEIQLINDYITVIVQDNGTGFTNSDLRIFSKPYFTTKKEGSGLGLSIVEKILNDHNGFIEFFSLEEGAKIKILLPKYVN